PYREGLVEVLRHRTDVANGRVLGLVLPRRNRQRADLLQNLLWIDGSEAFLDVAIADAGPRTTPVTQKNAGRHRLIRKEPHTAVASGGPLIVRGRCDIRRRIRIVAPHEPSL